MSNTNPTENWGDLVCSRNSENWGDLVCSRNSENTKAVSLILAHDELFSITLYDAVLKR
jgi:hypothetical protein